MKNNRTLIALSKSIFIFLALLVPVLVQADGLPYLQNPITCPTLSCLIVQVIKIILGFVAVIALFMFIYGGYLFLGSGGNAEAIRKGKDTLLWASLGIFIVIGSWVAVQFVLNAIANTSK